MAYTEVVMRRLAVLISVATLLVAYGNAVKGPSYTKGVLISLKHSTRARTTSWQSNTPIQTDDDVYDIKVQIGTTVYAGRYIPHEDGGTFPVDEWNEGDTVEARVVKRDLYLKRASGQDLRVFISKQAPATPLPVSPSGAPGEAKH